MLQSEQKYKSRFFWGSNMCFLISNTIIYDTTWHTPKGIKWTRQAVLTQCHVWTCSKSTAGFLSRACRQAVCTKNACYLKKKTNTLAAIKITFFAYIFTCDTTVCVYGYKAENTSETKHRWEPHSTPSHPAASPRTPKRASLTLLLLSCHLKLRLDYYCNSALIFEWAKKDSHWAGCVTSHNYVHSAPRPHFHLKNAGFLTT